MEQRIARFPFSHMAYGGDYNPEQWPEEIWQEDVAMMREAGVNLVSLGIFSWAKLEPEPGKYTFDWLDRIMDLLHAHGIRVDLATATASPPPWMAKLFPQTLPVTRDGVRLEVGSRQQYCPSSPIYRTAVRALVQHIAERYRNHPALALWHINNEYACHVSECFCEESARAFRVWLQRRYGSVEALNVAWGTAFWSQQYGAWDEIQPPRSAPTFQNPSQQLDWRRFSSDTLLECFDLERDVLKGVTPDVPVTTNFMVNFKPLDYWKWAAHEDLVSLDQYQNPVDPHTHIDAALNCDLMRSLAGGKNWLLMEQATSNVNWRPQNPPKQPGQLRLWSHQALARGSAGLMFFQWRASKAGAEKFHSGMLPHGGRETRTWREVTELGQELKKLDQLLPSTVQADVAIMLDWDNWWALELDSKPTAIRLLEQVRAYYDRLYERNITVDFVAPDSDLSRYKLLLLPNLYLVRDDVAKKIENYVANGGTVVMSFFSGIVNENDHIHLGGYPAPFRKLLGLRIEEFAAYAPNETNQIVCANGTSYSCDLWSDVIVLEGAEALANYATSYYSGQAAITCNEFGHGSAYYIGTRPSAEAMDWLLQTACADAKVAPAAQVPAGVEALRRASSDSSLLYLLNHHNAPIDVSLAVPGYDLLSGHYYADTITLPARGVALLHSEPSASTPEGSKVEAV